MSVKDIAAGFKGTSGIDTQDAVMSKQLKHREDTLTQERATKEMQSQVKGVPTKFEETFKQERTERTKTLTQEQDLKSLLANTKSGGATKLDEIQGTERTNRAERVAEHTEAEAALMEVLMEQTGGVGKPPNPPKTPTVNVKEIATQYAEENSDSPVSVDFDQHGGCVSTQGAQEPSAVHMAEEPPASLDTDAVTTEQDEEEQGGAPSLASMKADEETVEEPTPDTTEGPFGGLGGLAELSLGSDDEMEVDLGSDVLATQDNCDCSKPAKKNRFGKMASFAAKSKMKLKQGAEKAKQKAIAAQAATRDRLHKFELDSSVKDYETFNKKLAAKAEGFLAGAQAAKVKTKEGAARLSERTNQGLQSAKARAAAAATKAREARESAREKRAEGAGASTSASGGGGGSGMSIRGRRRAGPPSEPPSIAALAQLASLQAAHTQPMTAGSKEYEDLLKQLWELLLPDDAMDRQPGAHWERLGMQVGDPDQTLRGVGVLSVQCLVYFASKYTDQARCIVAARQPSATDAAPAAEDSAVLAPYPVLDVGLMLASVLCAIFQVESQEINPQPFWHLLTDPKGQPFFECFVIAMTLFEALWTTHDESKRADVRDQPHDQRLVVMLQLTKRMMHALFNLGPASVDQLRMLTRDSVRKYKPAAITLAPTSPMQSRWGKTSTNAKAGITMLKQGWTKTKAAASTAKPIRVSKELAIAPDMDDDDEDDQQTGSALHGASSLDRQSSLLANPGSGNFDEVALDTPREAGSADEADETEAIDAADAPGSSDANGAAQQDPVSPTPISVKSFFGEQEEEQEQEDQSGEGGGDGIEAALDAMLADTAAMPVVAAGEPADAGKEPAAGADAGEEPAGDLADGTEISLA
jgi:hypothetical protein